MNAIGSLLTLLACLLVMFAPRRVAVLGVFGGVCYITQGQMLDMGGFHFTAIRLILLVGLIRSVLRGEMSKLKFISIDWILIAFAIYTSVIEMLRHGTYQEPLGTAYNVLMSYFVFRCLVTDWEDIQDLLPKLALFAIPMALCMFREMHTGRSVFSFLGGLAEIDPDRNGLYRAAGAFRGPHCAGAFGAALIPLFVGLWYVSPQRRGVAVMGIIAATLITYTSNSSGPLMGYLASLVGLAFWPVRHQMRRVRWGIVVFLIFMSLTMKAPIWYLMAKLADITGGDGWYRSYLMEQCWNHMSDWWLLGTDNTGVWAVTQMSWGGADLCNMYVACASNGGLGCLILFIMLLVRSYQKLGRALEFAREHLPESEMIFWCLGVVLFAHIVTFFSVTYWDQMEVLWWGTLAILASTTSSVLDAVPAAETTGEIPEMEIEPTTVTVSRGQ